MMKALIYTIICITFIGLIACEKDVPLIDNGAITNNIDSSETEGNVGLDTLFPLSYFPVYPGSYWVYTNNDTIKSEPGYHPYAYHGSYVMLPYDSFMVPKWGDHYVFEYKISPGSMRVPEKQLLSETLDASWIMNYGSGHQSMGKTITKDTTIQINLATYDSVIVVLHYEGSANNAPSYINPYYWGSRDYFAKNIGLIRSEHRSSLDSLIVTDREIVDYFINN